ncbi:MAG: 50S ribosomal protein L10, partial [Zetaproteobacteria bacterium]|nr:50S ribosomal protein L10 [Zetaproteobacteria bacterium]
MAVTREKKEELREQFAERFNKASASVVAEYSGITAVELAELRVELRKVDTEFKVLKNRVAKKSLLDKAEGCKALEEKLKGPIGVAYMYGDVAAGAKALLAFAKENDKFKVTGGVMEGKSLSSGDVKALSDLPSKEELLGRIVGTLVSPHRGLLQVLNGVGT